MATPAILKILQKRNIYATFFLLGQNVRKFPDLAFQIKSEGHQIGNHSYSHTNLFFKKKEIIQKEILQAEEVLETILYDHSHIFRPPYGYLNSTILKVLEGAWINLRSLERQ